MSEQLRRRRQLANLERMQAERVVMTERRKQQMDDVIERKAREITKLRAQLTIGVLR